MKRPSVRLFRTEQIRTWYHQPILRALEIPKNSIKATKQEVYHEEKMWGDMLSLVFIQHPDSEHDA